MNMIEQKQAGKLYHLFSCAFQFQFRQCKHLLKVKVFEDELGIVVIRVLDAHLQTLITSTPFFYDYEYVKIVLYGLTELLRFFFSR
ncbi:Neuronal PAS domain-containing protein [Trichinella spiralis]|uniref:Neuronal PAS domain-containing protein n=1 Tax=Trichinella spiralis TaxID=6334 RepID=A0ABR3K580_TRISP